MSFNAITALRGAATVRLSATLRESFRDQQTLVVNLISSPGSGKTTLLEATVARLSGKLKMGGLDGSPADALGRGTGLSNTVQRLRALHADDQRLDLSNGPDGGLVVTVEVPWREAA